ncbi:MAG: hypothetical protein ACREF9_14305 [Opitutaceae bacterium]
MTAEPELITSIAEYHPVEAGLAVLRDKYAGVVFDIATAKGLDDARRARAEIREPRYECEKIRKRLKAPALEYSRRIDTEAARITAELEKLETPIDAIIKREEDAAEARREAKRRAEAERVARLRRIVEEIRAWPLTAMALNATGLRQDIERREAWNVEDLPEEIRQEAAEAKEEALGTLRKVLAAREVKDAEDARLAAERAAERERQAAEDKRLREERRRQQEEDAHQAAEHRRLAEKQAETERVIAEQWARMQRETREAEERLAAEHTKMERQFAAERARIAAQRAREELSSWPPSAASEPAEAIPDTEPGATIMRVQFEKRGVHYHCRVFTAMAVGQAFGCNGALIFDEAQWPDIPLLMRGAEFVEEKPARDPW